MRVPLLVRLRETRGFQTSDEAKHPLRRIFAPKERRTKSPRVLTLGASTSIFFLAFLLRVIGISQYPAGFTPDEASFGYDAYSLLKTGRDQWGENWPLVLRSFGDFKLPLYAYLTIPSVAIFGLNEFAVRLPSVIFGTLAVLFTYLMASEFSKKYKILNSNFAILSALLLAVSPWHISLSRGAFEANLTTFFIPLGIWAFQRGLRSPRWMALSTLAFSLNLFTYHSARVLTPLLLMGLVWFNRKELGVTNFKLLPILQKYKWAAIVFAGFVFLAFYTSLLGAGARGADIAIFNPTDKWLAVSEQRYGAVLQGLPDNFARIFSNKLTYLFDQFTANYLSYLSPQFLFTQGAGEWTYGMIPGRGVLYLIELPFVIVALWHAFRNGLTRTHPVSFFLLWILLAPIPAALTKGPGFAANRAAIMMPAIQILSAFGVLLLLQMLSKKFHKLFLFLFTVSLGSSLVFFLYDYRYQAPKSSSQSMLYGMREAVKYVSSIEDDYQEIVFSRRLSEPHIYLAFYKMWNPSDYQKESQDWERYEKERLSFVDQLGEYYLGEYTFRNIHYPDEKDKSLLVGKPREFPENVKTLKTIYYPDGQKAILVVGVNQDRR